MPATHALLGLLARGERHGYQLHGELEDEFGVEWRLDFGQLYRLLARMRRDGWVRTRSARGVGAPDRKLYLLTARGRRELRRWLREPSARVTRGRDEFPVKMRLALGTRSTPTEQLVAVRRRQLEAERHAHHTRYEEEQHAADVGRRWLAAARLRQTEGALAALTSAQVGRSGTSTAAELVAMGSDDLVMELLAQFLARRRGGSCLSMARVGSLDGLLALRDGRAHCAGIHLLDADSGEYNVPFVKHLLPEEPVVLVQLAHREQGLMIAPGDPKGIRRLADLTRTDVRLVNRQRGAGTRLFLFHLLRRARIDPHTIAGFARELSTHAAVAAAIADGSADVGPGIRAVAEAYGLDFIPLGDERYDLAIPRRLFDSRALQPLLAAMHAKRFRQCAEALSGYDVSRMGTIVADIH